MKIETVFDSLTGSFVHGVAAPPEPWGDCYWFLFHGDELVVALDREQVAVPRGLPAGLVLPDRHYLGAWDGTPCFCGSLDASLPVPDGYTCRKLRSLYQAIPDPLFAIAGRACQIVFWARTSRFCGGCGRPTAPIPNERAFGCAACGLEYFPRVTPAVLAAVIRDDRILLAWSQRMAEPRYSVLAGFVEAGESLEQCVRREVREETGIEVEGIEYFGSQPWPFPHSLMVAFRARYAGGEIKIEDRELKEARWFSVNRLPESLPGPISLSRLLIDWCVADITGARRHTPGPA